MVPGPPVRPVRVNARPHLRHGRFRETNMKILGIIGSPRKGGNTEIMINEVLKAVENEGLETDVIRLSDLDLKPCDGCRTCVKTKTCRIEDDGNRLFKMLEEADGFAVGSPVYVGSVSAQTKTFIDRMVYLNNARGKRPLNNKVGGALIVATRHHMDAYQQIILLLASAKMIIATAGWELGVGSERGDVARDELGMSKARELGMKMGRLAKVTATLRDGA